MGQPYGPDRNHLCGIQPGSHRYGQGRLLKDKELEYQIREENLTAQRDKELERSKELEEYRIYVQTKQYIEEVAKQKLGLVNPDEILLKPKKKE